MKKFGLVLIVVEIIAIVFGISRGDSPLIDLFTSDEAGISLIAKALGYLLPGIIGIVLYRKGKKKEAAAADTASPTGATSTYASSGSGATSSYSSASSASAAPAGRFCPKCGASVDADDAFCVNCGAKLK